MATEQEAIDYYEILGIAPSATIEEIRAAYRARIRGNPSTPANAIAALINEAGEVLGNPERRRQYDDYLNWQRPEVLLNIRVQIANARNTWGKLFEDDYNLQYEGKSEILKYMQENPDVPFETCVAHVLAPKAQANRDIMRAEILNKTMGRREANPENNDSEDTSNTIPPPSPSGPQPNAAVQESTSPASTLGVRFLGVLLIGAGVVFAWRGDRPGSDYNGWFVLLFWVCVLSAIYCFRQSGQSVRWLHVAAVRRTLLGVAVVAAIGVSVALTIGPLRPFVVGPSAAEMSRNAATGPASSNKATTDGAQIAGPRERNLSAANPAAVTQDNWTRTRDCAAQVEKVAYREHWDSDKTLLGSENHYSTQFGRCYVEQTRVNSEASKDPSVPPILYELFDAFEEKLLAICTDESAASFFCTVQDKEHFKDCAFCRSFVKERMTK